MGKGFNKTWELFSKTEKKINVNHWLRKSLDARIHKVNVLNIFKFSETHYAVINEETLVCKFFDTEQECIDYCLDVYPNSFPSEQLKLFDIE